MAGEQKELEPQKPHILLVEDEPLPFHEFLKISGYQVTQAKNGQEALDLLEGGLKPDLILTDFNMPQMNGLQLINRLKRERFHARPDR